MTREEALQVLRDFVDCGDCMECCTDPESRRAGILLVRRCEYEQFGLDWDGEQNRALFPCPFALDPGCALEGQPQRPLACQAYPLFVGAANTIYVDLLCPNATKIVRKWLFDDIDRANVFRAVSVLAESKWFGGQWLGTCIENRYATLTLRV